MYSANRNDDIAVAQEHRSDSDLDVLAHEKTTTTEPDRAVADNKSSENTQIIQVIGLEALLPTFSPAEALKANGIIDDQLASDISNLQGFQSPFAWSKRKKITVLSGAFLASCLAAYAAGAYALASQPLRSEWDISDTEFNAGITMFVLGFGFAPMILAPISEAHGRYWVFCGSGLIFLLGLVGCAVTDSYAGMLVSRFVVGSGASVYATLTGGVVSDLYHKEDRNTPMSLYSLSIMIGTGLGPLISGVVVDHLGWRWIFYLQAIAVGSTSLIIFLFFKETRSNVVLRRKCMRMNRLILESSSSPYLLEFQPASEERKFDISIIWRSFAFPLRLLVTESVVFWFSAWVSFAWAILYMQFSSIGIVFRDVYDFSNTQVGAVYTAVIFGSTISCFLSIIQESAMYKFYPQRMASPEGRLLAPGIQSILLPAGLFWFGWSSGSKLHWILPTIAIGSCTMGIFSIYLAVFNYLADSYHRYASSALAAQSMCRNILAGIFPLFTMLMLRDFGYGGAGSLLGGIGLLLTVIPWLLSFYGQKIRARSPLAGALLAS
ncbi:unnamed protein product [Clonostachys solani]|uniref:Major facilitator superfamily (MFS) profile domain-containing protein n=1 Tax=Clonostachys solani TaxID=160281 RepID=A0A9N9W2F5_9HYPO|nr:unnamed protein product [Clonostachys solani]